jgi:prephenate dehydrogenase
MSNLEGESPRWRCVCIVGVGLLGSSIGLALRQRGLAQRVVGVGTHRGRLTVAQRLGAIDQGTCELTEGVAAADLVVGCTPVLRLPELLVAAARAAPSDCLLTDVGSTKERLVATVEERIGGDRFLGAHPLAGGNSSGPESGRADLFEGRQVILTPTPNTGSDCRRQVERFWRDLGGEIRVMSAAEHDAAVAITSHLPHLVASALATATPESLLPLVAAGWLDTTRVAAGEPEMWRQILAENRQHVLPAMKNFATIWGQWVSALEADQLDSLADFLQAGKTRRDSVANRHSSGAGST